MSRGAAGKRYLTALCLFSFVFAACLLCFNGFPITDDEQLFISAAINRVNTGNPSAGQLYGNERLAGQYYGIGPLHVALGSVLYRLVRATQLGALQVMYLAAPLYLALSAVIICLLARRWRYSHATGIAAACLYAFGTMHWVYARTFFRETLATLLFLLMWLCFDILLERTAMRGKRLAAGALFLLAWAGILFTKVILGISLAIFLAAFLFSPAAAALRQRGQRMKWLPSVLVGVVLLLGVCTLAAGLLPDYFTNRVSDELLFRTWERIHAISHAGFFTALTGSLFSPGKGFFVYSPLLLAGVGAPLFYRQGVCKTNVFIAWGLLLSLAAAQALVYDTAWWNITWSTRYLLPAVPGFIMLALPFFEDALHGGSRTKKALFLLLAGSSILVEAGGVLMADPTYTTSLYLQNHNMALGDGWVWRFDLAPLVGHWKLIFSGTAWDFAAVRIMEQSTVEVMLLLGILFMAVLLSGIALYLLCGEKWQPGRKTLAMAALLVILEVSILPGALLQTYHDDPRYHAERQDFQISQAWMENQFEVNDTLLLQSYLSPAWYYAMNFYRIPGEWYSLPAAAEMYEGQQPADELRGWLEVLADEHRRLWLVEDFEDGELKSSLVRHYLDERYPVIEEETFSAGTQAGQTRVTLYDMNEK